ncbi:unnamed protein product [Brassica oleracea]|uniref:(rape) hypothetical protein n=1 Tax=Brassica napus TaxID=3708 RepID=A0A816IWK8_BRANA|nr:unnamed protein product [Brassica napus]
MVSSQLIDSLDSTETESDLTIADMMSLSLISSLSLSLCFDIHSVFFFFSNRS